MQLSSRATASVFIKDAINLQFHLFKLSEEVVTNSPSVFPLHGYNKTSLWTFLVVRLHGIGDLLVVTMPGSFWSISQ